jgi:hypothetical protein
VAEQPLDPWRFFMSVGFAWYAKATATPFAFYG